MGTADCNISSKLLFLKELEQELGSASSAIRICTPYYNSKISGDTFYIGNGYASGFFKSYQDIVNNWISAYKNNDKENIPSDKELMDLLSDIDTLTNVFQVYANVDYSDRVPIDKLGIEELNDLFIDLAKSTKTDSVYDILKENSLFEDYLVK